MYPPGLEVTNHWLNHLTFFQADVSSFSRMGIEPQDADPRVRDSEPPPHRLDSQIDGLSEPGLCKMAGDFPQRQVNRGEGYGEGAGGHHHAEASRVGQGREHLCMSRVQIASLMEGLFVNRAGDDRVNLSVARGVDSSLYVFPCGLSGCGGDMTGIYGPWG